MSHSGSQFNTLIAEVLVRTQGMLSEGNIVIPYGLLLSSSLEIESIMPLEVSKKLADTLDGLQNQMKDKVLNNKYLASAIVFADYEAEKVEAYLENNENYCLKINIPVLVSSKEIKLIPENIETEDGGIYMFPVTG